MEKKNIRIIFMGTPEFAVPSLNMLHTSGYNIIGVITAPDRLAGRGKKIVFSPVKEYALKHNLQLLQPPNLKDEEFLHRLSILKADIQIVIAFRMLPKSVWNMPKLGTINLHASLLPQYRGAAPINHAIINGEKITGLTTFFIDDKIDTGRIIRQLEVEIAKGETFGELYDKLKEKGVSLIKETVDLLISGKEIALEQDKLIIPGIILKQAPKIFKEDCRINWDLPVNRIYNLIRGLDPSPGAFSFLLTDSNKKILIKIFSCLPEKSSDILEIGKVDTDQKSYLKVAAYDGYLKILELQLEGKKKMAIKEFLRGHQIKNCSFLV